MSSPSNYYKQHRNRTITEHAEETSAEHLQIRTLFKGKKYNWQAKVNFHIHIIEHVAFNTIEIVVYNTGTFKEAPHVYVPHSVVNAKVHVEVPPMVATEVRREFAELGIEPPQIEEIAEVMRQNEIAAFILDRINVTIHPEFTIDVRDFENTYRIIAGTRTDGENVDEEQLIKEARRISIANSQWSKDVISGALTGVANANFERFGEAEPASFSLLHRKPESVDPSYIKRIGKSTTLVGEVMREERVSKYTKLLQEFVTKYTSADAQKITKETQQRISFLNKQHKHRNVARKVNTTFHKFKRDEELLQAALSYIHISDYFILQTVCKLWHQVLFAALRSMRHMSITSRDSSLAEMAYLQARGVAEVGYMWAKTGRQDGEASAAPQSKDSAENKDAASLPQPPQDSPTQPLQPRLEQLEQLRLQWRDVFVLPGTVQAALTSTAVRLHAMRLNYVVLDAELLEHLKTLNGTLKHLSLGIIRVNDGPPPQPAEPPVVTESASAVSPHPPQPGTRHSQVGRSDGRLLHRVLSDQGLTTTATTSTSSTTTAGTLQSASAKTSTTTHANTDPTAAVLPTASTLTVTTTATTTSATPMALNTGKGILNRRRQQLQAAAQAAAEKETAPPPPPRPSRPVHELRHMDGQDVARILRACGAGVTHLELSVTIGPIPPEVFRHCPKLTTVTALDTAVATALPSKVRDLNGPVVLDHLVQALKGISVPSLLCLLFDSPQEALALLDRTGHFCVISPAFERLTGRRAEELCGQTVHCLTGALTDVAELRRVEECLALQDEPVKCNIHLQQPKGAVILVQCAVLPNVVVHQGLPLEQHCLTLEYLEQLAFGVTDATTSAKDTEKLQALYGKPQEGIHEFVQGLREHHYHLMRLGALSQPFQPVSVTM